MAESHFIGIDIGATLIKMGVVTREGKLLARDEIETREVGGPAHFVKLAGEAFGRLLARARIERRSIGAIGFGAPGWVDHQRGIVHELTNIPNWNDFPLVSEIEKLLGVSAFVDNDANVMAVGETLHGAGRGRKNFICLTLGTGVGGAIIIDGALYRGANGLAGEVGHMSIDIEGRACACGARGCLENYVGHRAIVARALELMEKTQSGGVGSVLYEMAGGDRANITTKTIAEAAEKGDKIALEVWRETGFRLGSAMAGLINVLNPECFIIGGGVARAGSVLFDQVKETMASLAMNKLGQSTPIFKAELGEDAGLIGAAAFAMLCSESD